jgi:hypothetical protein
LSVKVLISYRKRLNASNARKFSTFRDAHTLIGTNHQQSM